MRLAAAVLASVAALASCGAPAAGDTDSGLPPEDGGTAHIELGTGDAFFVALADGADLELVHGPQGGYHLLTSVRATSIPPDVHVGYEIRDEADAAVLSMPSDFVLNATRVVATSTGWVRSGDRAIFQTVVPAEVVGRTLHLHATVTCACGTFTDARTVHVVDLVP